MRKETHIRNSHKWTRCAILSLALTVTPLMGAVGMSAVSHRGGTLAGAAVSTASVSTISTDSSKWT